MYSVLFFVFSKNDYCCVILLLRHSSDKYLLYHYQGRMVARVNGAMILGFLIWEFNFTIYFLVFIQYF